MLNIYEDRYKTDSEKFRYLKLFSNTDIDFKDKIETTDNQDRKIRKLDQSDKERGKDSDRFID